MEKTKGQRIIRQGRFEQLTKGLPVEYHAAGMQQFASQLQGKTWRQETILVKFEMQSQTHQFDLLENSDWFQL
ncbi:MAG: hypothetical protein A2091_04335 [Desulfuromonadales bacterium GWD2_61_12]|nr:MAG: hypothetical protein A2005_04355 [Desulfuromonadales bacterium GWC2_61_20]OGR33014.1 MAG: hypothetical protein A2091_04335 [Desulfuromonadales bacterium GWD2_61_12]